ncbi:PREDICTED: uncharacterized protein [Prunus dulcis]|uniref:PREDICTED: uncharacterized protein n=1 Tax=Prunus dulcis TaxID=3755 RepID=A0A5E4G2V2_PRUDU|nr:PREDICTED: uncharacterized protein [Prunus dulcis]
MLLHQGVCILLIRNSIPSPYNYKDNKERPSVFLTIVVLCDFRGEDETRNFTPLCPLLLVLWLSVRVPDFYLNSSLCASLLFSTTRMTSLDVLEDELMMEERSIRFDDSLDLEENIENKITLVGLLIADHEPTQGIVKDVLRAIWTNMGQVKVLKAKENVYSITELSRFGESLDNSLFEGAPSFKKSHCGFSYGNKAEQPQYKELEETVWLS